MEENILVTLNFNLFTDQDLPSEHMTSLNENQNRGNARQRLPTNPSTQQPDKKIFNSCNPSYSCTPSHTTLHQMLIVSLELTSAIIHQQRHSFYIQTTKKLYYLYFYHLYTSNIKKSLLQRLLNPKYAILIIIKASLIILTQCKGNFPQILWLQQLFGFKRNYLMNYQSCSGNSQQNPWSYQSNSNRLSGQTAKVNRKNNNESNGDSHQHSISQSNTFDDQFDQTVMHIIETMLGKQVRQIIG